jgi:predicted ATPase/DNA-binding CsgD family transcriptional regulator
LEAVGTAIRRGRRLVTLTGTGGVGKTRLAIEAAHQLSARFDGAVLTVWLAPVANADDVPAEIARAAAWDVHDERSVDEVVRGRLSERPTLLMLDNCEHLEHLGRVVTRLIDACDDLTILATSRRALDAPLEHIVAIDPLPVADSIDVLVGSARRNDSSFTITAGNRPVLTELVQRLDGLPLALHLAAARLHVMTPDEMVRALDRRFDLLKGRTPSESPHHTRLQTMIDWSYRLQPPEDQRRFRSFGVFPHTFTREAAATIAGCDPLDMLDTLAALVDHHLVRAMEREGAAARFGLLESLREFALTELAANAELDDACRAHAHWIAELAEREGPRVASGDEQAFATLVAEIDNIRAATNWADVHDRRLVLRLGSLWRFWQRVGLMGEGIAVLRRALAEDPPLDATSAAAMRGLANLLDDYGDLDEAVAWAQLAVATYERLGDVGELARARVCLAHPERERGNLDRAVRLYEQAAKTFQRLGWRREQTTALNGMGAVAYRRGDFTAAVAHWERCLAIVREIGDRESESLIAGNVGVGRFGVGDLHGALVAYAEAIEIAEQLDAPVLLVSGLLNRVEVLLSLGDTDAARADLDRLEALVDADDRRMSAVLHRHRGVLAEHQGRLGDALAEHYAGLSLTIAMGRVAESAEDLDYAARAAAGLDELEVAGRLVAASERIRGDTGSAPVTPIAADLQAIRERAAAAGFAVSLDDAPDAEQALEELRTLAIRRAGGRRAREDPLRRLGLTARECEVARLLMARRTDPEIAAQLFIGVRTVATHVSAVLRKLGLKSRREVAAALAEVEGRAET